MRKISWIRKSICLGGKACREKVSTVVEENCELRKRCGLAERAYLISSAASRSFQLPGALRDFLLHFFVSFKATKHLQSLDLEGFCSFTFSSQHFFVQTKQSFNSTTGRTFPRLLIMSPLQILFCGAFQSVLVVVCGAYENPPRRSNRPRESLTHSAGEIHGGG